MEFTHFDQAGNAWMVDVSGKEDTKREAVAEGRIYMSRECYDKVAAGNMKKGDVLAVARIAGIMGAKRTEELIPLCHKLNITGLEVWFEMGDTGDSDRSAPDKDGDSSLKNREDQGAKEKSAPYIRAFCRAGTTGKTGVEMEALTGVQIALLTIYDMCKAVDKRMVISDVHLVSKCGGKSGDFHA